MNTLEILLNKYDKLCVQFRVHCILFIHICYVKSLYCESFHFKTRTINVLINSKLVCYQFKIVHIVQTKLIYFNKRRKEGEEEK